MPKSHFLSLVIRLVIAFLILGLIAFLLFRKLRGPSEVALPTPTPLSTQGDSVVVVTPEPLATPLQLPDVSNDQDTHEAKEEPTSVPRHSSRKPHHPEHANESNTVSTNHTQTTEARSANGLSSARAEASGTYTEASASAGDGFASAHASARSE